MTLLHSQHQGKRRSQTWGHWSLGLIGCLKMRMSSLPFFRACLRSSSPFLQL